MPLHLEGSCRCGAVAFALDSHTPVPCQRCYCSICRKQDGGGGYAVNLGGVSASLKVEGRDAIGVYRAVIDDDEHACETSTGERSFCTKCGTALWLYDPAWPDLIHPFASAIDTDLPIPPARVHLMLKYRANWAEPEIRDGDECFDLYPALSLEDWHRKRGLWAE